jgi:hypothetical protein
MVAASIAQGTPQVFSNQLWKDASIGVGHLSPP